MPKKLEYTKGQRCGKEDNCRSTLYYKENSFQYCKRGHLQEGIPTQQDEDDFGTQGRKTRVRRETKEKVSQIYRGATATELYLQSYQLILWKQCYALVHTTGLPAELETVVKDLWALRLQLLKSKTDATSDEDTMFSSQPQSETETEDKHEGVGRKWKVRGKIMPSLIETLGLCYLGTILLRLPVSIGEMHRWAVREDIPFIRAVRFVPAIMKQRLPAQYLKALDTTSPLELDQLRKTIHNLSLFYTHHFALVFPPLNAPLLLYKQIRNLSLPITLHLKTLEISRLLLITFAFPLPSFRQQISSLPEIQLICLLIITVKLYHPFDGFTRHVRSLADSAVLTIDWATWVDVQSSHKLHATGEAHVERGSEINVTERDVMDMTGEQLDDYMDWYERTYVDESRVEEKARGLPKQLLDMFPIGRTDGSSPTPYNYDQMAVKEQETIDKRLNVVMGKLRLRNVVPDNPEDSAGVHGDSTRIGSFYKRYRKVEDLTPHAKVFHEAVAEAIGVRLESLILAVGQVERSLVKWREAKVKADKEEGDALMENTSDNNA